MQDAVKNKTISYLLTNSLIILFQTLYILLRYKYLNDEIPLWQTRQWGDYQLAPSNLIYIFPLISAVITLLGLFLIVSNRFYIRYLDQVVRGVVIFSNLFLSMSVFRIVIAASAPFTPILSPQVLKLLVPGVLSFLVTQIVLPFFIDFAQEKKLVTNPKIHNHPAMILQGPTARGGGFVYGIVFLLLSALFVGFRNGFLGLYISVFMISILGILDDYQNTHPSSDMRLLEKPYLRLVLLFFSVLPVIFSGSVVSFIGNPFGSGVIELDILSLEFLGRTIPILAFFFSALWMVWVMNVLSWSNGIDGQYAGIVGIASVLIALLSLRFEPLRIHHTQMALLASISAGISFGFTKSTWHPSKIMWGFGALTAGVVIAALSINVQSKIVASVLIILIPFMDALVTVFRRLLQKKNPLSGDRGHLHHLLLDKGWSPRGIALFYWFSTAIFGIIGLISPEKYIIQVALIIIGLVAFGIILINLSSIKRKQTIQSLE